MPHDSDAAAPSAEHARVLLDDARSATDAARAESRWVVTYLAAFGMTALVLVPLGAFVDRWPVAAVVNVVWVLALVVLPIWSSKRRATPRGAGWRMEAAFLAFGVLYCLTAGLGITVFQGQLWWWSVGGVACAVPLLGLAVWEARR